MSGIVCNGLEICKNMNNYRYNAYDNVEERAAVNTVLDIAKGNLERDYQVVIDPDTLAVVFVELMNEAMILVSESHDIPMITLAGRVAMFARNNSLSVKEYDAETIGNITPIMVSLLTPDLDTDEAQVCNKDDEKQLLEANPNANSADKVATLTEAIPNPELMCLVEARLLRKLERFYHLHLPYAHLAIALWVVTYDALIQYCKERALEDDGGYYKLNFQGVFTTTVTTTGDNGFTISHEPERGMKLTVKSDERAYAEFNKAMRNQYTVEPEKDYDDIDDIDDEDEDED